jgi:biotin-dependent carboxylase-like uncharacterized protein
MGSCILLQPGALTTLQDNGRSGYAQYAIPSGGVMDVVAAHKAQQLVGNDPDWPIVECTLKGPKIKFESETKIALTGGDMQWKLNGKLVERNAVINVQANDILSSGFTKDQPRSYLAISGKITTRYHYNSCSTYGPAQLGHKQGQALAAGDRIEWVESHMDVTNQSLVDQNLSTEYIHLHRGPEYNLLSEESKQLLVSEQYKVGPDSNRMGARLLGPKLISGTIKKSVPVLPGFMQLPPSGFPIVVLQDGQTTGGYPRIAFLKSQELYIFNRLPIGQLFRFQLVS